MEIILIAIIAMVGLVLLYPRSIGRKTCQLHKQERFTEEIRNLHVESSSVDVEVRKAEREDWNIVLSGTVYDKDKDHFTLISNHQGENFTVKVTEENTRFGIQMQRDMKLLVEVPEEAIGALVVGTSSGDIDAKELNTTHTTLTASSGDVTMNDVVQENLQIETSSGDVLLRKVQSRNTEIHTSSGELFGEAFTYGTGVFRTSSGEIRLQSQKMLGDVSASTSSGDIRLFFEEEPASCTLIYQSNSGEAMINWTGLDYEVKKKNEVRASKTDGAFRVMAETSSGDLKVG